MGNTNLSAAEAMEKLKEGNQRYLEAKTNPGDVSVQIRKKTCEEGQVPYAIVIPCSDSRVIPESIFSAGIGVEYAAGHLKSALVVVLGHTHCGAVGAALTSEPDGYVKFITDEIRKAIGDEKDETRACCLNVERSVSIIKDSLDIKELEVQGGLKVCGAMYHIDSGKVEFLD